MANMTHLTEIQRDALPIIDQDPTAPAIAPVTLDRLVAKGLIERFEHDGHRSAYRLTGSGELLCGEITQASVTAPAVPDDPWALVPTETEGL